MPPTSKPNSPISVSISSYPQGKVATITLSNPKRLNSLSATLLTELKVSVNTLAQTLNLRCVVITGGPLANRDIFSAGIDISEAKAWPDAKAAREAITRLHLACKSLREIHVPVIARVNGHALGGGLGIAASADLRIASSTAMFGMPEVQRGVPSTIEAALLPRQIGAARGRRLLLLGDLITAEQAESWGLVDRVVDRKDLDGAVEEWVQLILRNGADALRAQKRLMAVWEQVPLREAIDAGIWEFGKAFEGQGMEAEGRRMMNEFGTPNKKKSKL
ncbi:enoyl-CoA hydratase [Exophiala viscosa]|uniref:Enoyl-CoA hydratase n=1 Tax=Exophiala viscosa TaxID=2486360 RepID=A0AAN6DMX0_9EURO|nr:enoyl-CoA hydratase [Exophiala viscosa]